MKSKESNQNNETIFPNGFTFRDRDYKYHIVTHFFDDSNGEIELFYVVRYYGKRRQYWHYEIQDEDTVKYNIKKFTNKK